MKYIFILLLIPFLSFSQERRGGVQNDVLANNLGDFALQKIDAVYHNEFRGNVSGNTYLFDDWKLGLITTTKNNNNNKEYSFSILINYNLKMDRFEIKMDNDIYFLEKQMVKEIRVGNKAFIPTPTNYKDEIKSYMELLGEGEDFKLVKIYSLKIKGVQSKTSLGLYETKVTVKDKRFFVDNDGKFQEVPSSKKKIYEILDLSKEEREAITGNIKKTENLVQAL